MDVLTAQQQYENNLARQSYIEQNNNSDNAVPSDQNDSRVEYVFYSPQDDTASQKDTTAETKSANQDGNLDIDKLVWNGIKLGLFFLKL